MKRGDLSKLKSGTWVRVHWYDIVSADEGWIKPEDSKSDLAPILTCGIVVKRDKKMVVLAMSVGKTDKEIGTTWAIPLGVISQVEVWP